MPAAYKTEDGYALGAWIKNIRKSYRTGAAALTREQIERLEAIGMFWGNRRAESWESSYRAAEKYYRTHGDLGLTSGYVTEDGLALGKWVVEQRLQRKRGAASLTPERIARLNAIGMIWDKASSWEYRYALCRKYLEEHKSTSIPRDYKTADGIWLGTWLYRQRRLLEGYPSQQKLSERQQYLLRQLEGLGKETAENRKKASRSRRPAQTDGTASARQEAV